MFISSNDAKSLTAASGVGLKLAQRIVLELKDKVGALPGINNETVSAVSSTVTNSSSKEAVEVLVSLGYSHSEASLAVSKLDKGLPTETLIKEALKSLARMV